MRNVGILGTDGAGVVVSDVDAADGQSDIGDHAVDLVRWDRLANAPLDQVAQARRLLDPRADLGAHVHEDAACVDGRKKVFPEERE